MYQPAIDLAEAICFRPSFWQTKTRINDLIDQYFSTDELCDRLEDLPQWFQDPQPRKWSAINWQDINPEQVIGIELDIFLSIIKGSLDTTEQLIKYLLSQINTILPVSSKSNRQNKSNLKSIFQRMMSVLNWQSWSILSRGELIYTFVWTLEKMWHWSSQLTPEYLQSCCASPEFFGNNSIERYQSEIMIL